MDDRVRFGCISCKRTKRTAAIDAAAEKTMFQVFTSAFDLIQREGIDMGIPVPQELRAKLIKWGQKYSMFPEDPETAVAVVTAHAALPPTQ